MRLLQTSQSLIIKSLRKYTYDQHNYQQSITSIWQTLSHWLQQQRIYLVVVTTNAETTPNHHLITTKKLPFPIIKKTIHYQDHQEYNNKVTALIDSYIKNQNAKIIRMAKSRPKYIKGWKQITTHIRNPKTKIQRLFLKQANLFF